MTTATATVVRYDVVDRQTRKVVGSFKSGSRATAMVDRKDNAYGAYRYSRVAVWSDAASATVSA